LGQLISLRYGTIPIVRATGGLADTVSDFDPDSKQGNGFVFEEYLPEKLQETIYRALEIYEKRKDLWTFLVKTALQSDFSWPSSAVEYVQLYNTALEKRIKK